MTQRKIAVAALLAMSITLGQVSVGPSSSIGEDTDVFADLRAASDSGNGQLRNHIIAELSKEGTRIIAAGTLEIKKGAGSRSYREDLLEVVARGKPLDESTKALVEIATAVQDDELAAKAGAWIDNRIITFPLSSSQLAELKRQMATASGSEAAQWAYALARSTTVNDQELVQPTLSRYLQAIHEVQKARPANSSGAYLSGTALYLNQFLRAFAALERSIAVREIRAQLTEQSNEWATLWLRVASAMNGDKEAATALLPFIETESNESSERALALRAYARALGEASLDILRQRQLDSSPGPLPGMPPVQVIARDELVRLERGETAR